MKVNTRAMDTASSELKSQSEQMQRIADEVRRIKVDFDGLNREIARVSGKISERGEDAKKLSNVLQRASQTYCNTERKVEDNREGNFSGFFVKVNPYLKYNAVITPDFLRMKPTVHYIPDLVNLIGKYFRTYR